MSRKNSKATMVSEDESFSSSSEGPPRRRNTAVKKRKIISSSNDEREVVATPQSEAVAEKMDQSPQSQIKQATTADAVTLASRGKFCKFRIPPNPEGFRSSTDVVRLLEKSSDLQFALTIARDSGLILTPKNAKTETYLQALDSIDGKKSPIIVLHPEDKAYKMVLLGYPLQFGVDTICEHPKVVTAQRCLKNGQQTKQVLVTLKGDRLTSLSLGNWGRYKLRTYVPDPRRCYRCQRYGHFSATCRAKAVCGVCSGPHDSKVCISAHKNREQGQKGTLQCPNCRKKHPAWSLACPVRKKAAERGQAIAQKSKNYVPAPKKYVPAPPSKFVWGRDNIAKAGPPSKGNAKRLPTPAVNSRKEFPSLPKREEPKPQRAQKPREKAKAKEPAPKVVPQQQSSAVGSGNITIQRDMLITLMETVVSAAVTALGHSPKEVAATSKVWKKALSATLSKMCGDEPAASPAHKPKPKRRKRKKGKTSSPPVITIDGSKSSEGRTKERDDQPIIKSPELSDTPSMRLRLSPDGRRLKKRAKKAPKEHDISASSTSAEESEMSCGEGTSKHLVPRAIVLKKGSSSVSNPETDHGSD